MTQSSTLNIAIIGAGFSGTAFVAACQRLSKRPLHLHVFEKSGRFATGDAYRTPFSYHLLNVNAKDMSAFEDDPSHFVAWLKARQSHPLATKKTLDADLPLEEQFLPRSLYGEYLNDLLQAEGNHQLTLEAQEVIDLVPHSDHIILILSDQRQIKVDKVVLALGNQAPAPFPFPVTNTVQCIRNPWEYRAPNQISKDDPVLIVGTGLSMIDTVLTLKKQSHRGAIYAVSRHGLLPLPHTKHKTVLAISRDSLPSSLRSLTQFVREKCRTHADWQAVINGLRSHIPSLWAEASVADKKRFLRHLLAYWNVHRHRVHQQISAQLAQLIAQGQLKIIAGRVLAIENQQAIIRPRHEAHHLQLDVKWIINCMGPALNASAYQSPLLANLLQKKLACLDPLQLGLDVASSGALKMPDGEVSSRLFALGSLRRGALWEVSAVPEIRKQCFELANLIQSS